MRGLRVVGIAAGLWHTLCITDIGDVYAFGGNQFGQLGVGGNTAEVAFLFPLNAFDFIQLKLIAMLSIIRILKCHLSEVPFVTF